MKGFYKKGNYKVTSRHMPHQKKRIRHKTKDNEEKEIILSSNFIIFICWLVFTFVLYFLR